MKENRKVVNKDCYPQCEEHYLCHISAPRVGTYSGTPISWISVLEKGSHISDPEDRPQGVPTIPASLLLL
jgi:hypothetical protein